MAQKRDKEETELKLPNNNNNIPLCTPPQTIPAPSPPQPQLPPSRSPESSDPKLSGACAPTTSSNTSPEIPITSKSLKRPREVTRCSGSNCRKKIGLIGFRCRCGDVFCSEHRYSDRHDCSYDYKAAGREAIAKENPVVKAAKLVKV